MRNKNDEEKVVLTEALPAVPHGSLGSPVVSGVPEHTATAFSSAGLTNYLTWLIY